MSPTLRGLFLQKNSESGLRALKLVCRQADKSTYSFMPAHEYWALLGSNLPRANQVYWREMLQRAHFGAITGLMRHLNWTDGIILAIETENLHAFAACLRALIEHTADLNYSLNYGCINLAQNYEVICCGLNGKLGAVVQVDGLEDAFLHFAYGRNRPGKEAPRSHAAKKPSEYLGNLAPLHEDMNALYSLLCEITHPAARSLWCFTDTDWVADPHDFFLARGNQQNEIRRILEKYSGSITVATQLAENLCLILLQLLNRFPYKRTHNPTAEKFNLRSIPLWMEVERLLKFEKNAQH